MLTKENISVLCVHPYDLLVNKIGQGLQKDIDDLLYSEMLSEIDIGKLKRLYSEASSYWIGDPEKFSKNWKKFIERVQQRKADILL